MPNKKAVGVARLMKDYFEHGAKGVKYTVVLAKVACFLIEYAEALDEPKERLPWFKK